MALISQEQYQTIRSPVSVEEPDLEGKPWSQAQHLLTLLRVGDG